MAPHHVAEALGSAYARLQHGIDRVVGWGFRKLRDTDRPGASPEGRLLKAGKGILGFIGRAGDAYYETYDRLKRRDPPGV